MSSIACLCSCPDHCYSICSCPYHCYSIDSFPDHCLSICSCPDHCYSICSCQDHCYSICSCPDHCYSICSRPDHCYSICRTNLNHALFQTLRWPFNHSAVIDTWHSTTWILHCMYAIKFKPEIWNKMTWSSNLCNNLLFFAGMIKGLLLLPGSPSWLEKQASCCPSICWQTWTWFSCHCMLWTRKG